MNNARQLATSLSARRAGEASCWRLVTVAIATATIVTAAGCASSVDKQNRRSGAAAPAATAPADPPPKGEPVEVAGSFGTARTYYQSRGVVALDVKSTAIKLGDQFSLINETTKATLIDHHGAAFQLVGDTEEQGVGWHLIDAYDVTLRLYLQDPAFAHSFVPGENKLRLLVDDGDAGRMAETSITLRDFGYFALSTSAFPSGEQRASGFQGGFEPFAKALVTSGGQGSLATGFLTIVNQ